MLPETSAWMSGAPGSALATMSETTYHMPSNPIVVAFRRLLAVAGRGGRRRRVLESLRSGRDRVRQDFAKRPAKVRE